MKVAAAALTSVQPQANKSPRTHSHQSRGASVKPKTPFFKRQSFFGSMFFTSLGGQQYNSRANAMPFKNAVSTSKDIKSQPKAALITMRKYNDSCGAVGESLRNCPKS
jgi:hypothetical protein